MDVFFDKAKIKANRFVSRILDGIDIFTQSSTTKTQSSKDNTVKPDVGADFKTYLKKAGIENEVLSELSDKTTATAQSGLYYLHGDHLGTASFVTDENSESTQFFLNLPFGETMYEQQSGVYDNPYKFNAKELDQETGLYYYDARYYNPKFSIWYGVDPLAEKYPGWSPYNYTMDNPINFIDPDGRDPKPYVLNGVHFVPLSIRSMALVTRSTGGTFTNAAIKRNTRFSNEYVINMQQYETLNKSAAMNYRFGSNIDMNDLQTQGLTIVRGKQQPYGRSSNSYYMAMGNNGSFSAGLGNPPSDSKIAFGGGIPLIINGMPYGAEKKYDKSGKMIQNSSAGYPLQNDSNIGKTILAFNSDGNFMIVSQQDETSGMNLDQIRDYLILKKFTNAISFDGSTSATLVQDGKIIVKPSERKDNSIPVGLKIHGK